MATDASPPKTSRKTIAFIVAASLLWVVGEAGNVVFVYRGWQRLHRQATIAGDLAAARGTAPGTRVLFVGNSFTYRNDLPGMVRAMARDLDRPRTVYAVSYTRPYASLADAASSGELRRLIASAHWDYVVLQERSLIPSLAPAQRDARMRAPILALAREIRADGATPLLYETWGYRTGNPALAGDTFDAMNSRVVDGYETAARTGDLRIVPAGAAFARDVHAGHLQDLWAGDGQQPSLEGTYLAAATVVQTLFPGSTSTFTAGLGARAAQLQRDATVAVAGAPKA